MTTDKHQNTYEREQIKPKNLQVKVVFVSLNVYLKDENNRRNEHNFQK